MQPETPNGEVRPTSTPAVDVYENDNEILVVADLPGARPESVNVKLEKDQLFISANRDGEPDGGAQRLYGGNRRYEYRRTFVVPRGVDPAQVTADMNDGVLRVHLPKSTAAKPRTITVKTQN
jgi:HSP20 family molecular chaperone IbpA